MKVNLAAATAAINKSSDKSWLQGFRDRMVAAGESDVVDVLDHRLAELKEVAFRVAVGEPIEGQSLVERVRESVRIYEEFLARKHANSRRANKCNDRTMGREGSAPEDGNESQHVYRIGAAQRSIRLT